MTQQPPVEESNQPPLLDRLQARLKNKKAFAYLVIATTVFGLLGQVLGIFEKVADWFRPPPQPEFAFYHRTLEGHAVTLFLNGKLPPEFKEQIGVQYQIYKNDVWDYGNFLYDRYHHD